MAPESSITTLYADAWAAVVELVDMQFSPLGRAAIDALSPQRGEAIADVGCGAGQTVLQIAELVGPSGRVFGVDIEPKLVAIAASRAARLSQVTMLNGDAATIALPKAGLDGVFSRFGVMAFDDPVATFRHLHGSLRKGGRLAFVCWRPLLDNELDYLPLQAAGLEEMADQTPFSFAEPSFLRSTLSAAGYQKISIVANDVMVSSGDVDAMMAVVTKVGALGKILRENPRLRASAEPRVRAALSTRSGAAGVCLNAATWIVTARA